MTPEAAAHCPTCGAEYRAGFDVCADDGAPLVPGPFPEPIPEPVQAPPARTPPVSWTTVANFADLEIARLLAGRLESEGIEARVFPEEFASYYGPVSSRLWGQPIQVLVPEDRLAEAEEIVRTIEQG